MSSETSTAPAASKTYNGSCHCSAIKYTLTLSPPLEETSVAKCNCSICSERGMLIVRVPKDGLNVTFPEQGEDKAVNKYTFNKKAIEWNVCSKCGSTLFGWGESFGMYGVNVRTLKDVDFDKLDQKPYDGASV